MTRFYREGDTEVRQLWSRGSFGNPHPSPLLSNRTLRDGGNILRMRCPAG